MMEKQLTHDAIGHCLNSTQAVSHDGRFLVYDTRNVDAALAGNGEIRVLNVETGEDMLVYKTENQGEFGPGVGAATFSPVSNRVMFLAGIVNADSSNPYSMTRRTGFAVDIDKPGTAIRLDARNIVAPYTPGALRGGTHAHTWSGDGQWISFTYNDHILHEALTKPGKGVDTSAIIDTRTVGIMFPRAVEVPGADGIENISGTMFSVLVTKVVKNPASGSDEISRAFDECWLGRNGYLRPDGSRQKRAIAFQGELVDSNGQKKTEIFVADIPEDLSARPSNQFSAGTSTALPEVPVGVTQRRISFTSSGVSPVPRHWLRSSPDGSLIAYLAEDEKGIVQLWTISPNGGSPVRRTTLDSSISGPINFNRTGIKMAFIVNQSIMIHDMATGTTESVFEAPNTWAKLVGAVNWSPVADKIFFNRYSENGSQEWMQIYLLTP